jgi:hypothetical protein
MESRESNFLRIDKNCVSISTIPKKIESYSNYSYHQTYKQESRQAKTKMNSDKFNEVLASLKEMSIQQRFEVFHEIKTMEQIIIPFYTHPHAIMDDMENETVKEVEPFTTKEWETFENKFYRATKHAVQEINNAQFEVVSEIRPNWKESEEEEDEIPHFIGFRFHAEGSKKDLLEAKKELNALSQKFGLRCVIDDAMYVCNEGSIFANPSLFVYGGDATWYEPTKENYNEMRKSIIDMGCQLFGDVDYYEH